MEEKLQIGDLELDIFSISNIDRSFLVKIISHLKPEFFESRILGKIFNIYEKFFNKFNQIPTKRIVKEILDKSGSDPKESEFILNKIYDNKKTINAIEKQYILDEVVTFGKRARMKEAIIKSVDLLDKNDFESITNEIREALLFNLDVNIGYDLFDVDKRYKNLRDSLKNKMSTGYGQLDKVLNGGWSRKELIAILGPPGIGKSIFLPNFGFKALLNGYNVAHYSLEMSEDRLGLRYDAIASNININTIMSKSDEVKRKYNMIKKLTKTHLKLKEFPTSTATVLDIESHLEELKLYENFIPDIIIVDYGDIMRAIKRTKNLYEEQGWIFKELRSLAVKRNIAIITATQANRESFGSSGQGTKEVVGMQNTSDSMEKNRILDALFSIVQNPKEKDEGRINLWIAKNRNGPSNTYLQFLINYSTMQIKENLLNTSRKKEDE